MSFDGTFHENVYVLGLAAPAHLGNASYPASGYYIDVSDYNKFMFMVHCGAMTSSGDFTVKSATSATGGLVSVTSANKTDLTASTDDKKWFSIEVESARLPTTHRLVSLVVTGMGGTDYWSAMFYAWEARHGSPTQSTGYDSHTVIAG